MRMQFGIDDEAAFHVRRDELVQQFGEWLGAAHVPGADAGDAGIALDWKWGYRGGDLATWTVADLEDFLLGWCPRKLSMAAEECRDFPASIGAFCRFLDDRGLLGSRSDRVAALSRWCERNTERFVAEMADPANYGMAKSLFGRVGGLEPGLERSEETMAELLERVADLPPEAVGEVLERIGAAGELPTEPITVGPVRLPDAAERVESAAAAPVLRQLRKLREFCAPPGRPLTQKGNLRLADARALVDLLETGDVSDVDTGVHRRSLRSAEDLPVLSWLVQLGLDARALRRHRGRLVAVARWGQRSEVEALEALVDAAVEAGLSGELWHYFVSLAPVQDFVDGGVGRLLAELLAAETDGEAMPIDELVEMITGIVAAVFPRLPEFSLGFVPGWVRRSLERLAALGVLTLHDVQHVTTEWGDTEAEAGTARLTAAGIPVAVRLAEDIGITVLTRPDPTTATAEDIVGLAGAIPAEDWLADATTWASRLSAPEAAGEIVAALRSAERGDPAVLATLGKLDELLGEHATPAVRSLLDGPHDGLAVNWLVEREALDPATVGPARMLGGFLDVLGIALDTGGPEAVTEMLGGTDSAQVQADVLGQLWRSEHPRTAELLEVIGRQHPDKRVAKTARKTLIKHRSWIASRR